MRDRLVNEQQPQRIEPDTIARRARRFLSQITERFARNVVAPPPESLVDHVLVIVGTFEADEEVVAAAIERGKQRAQEGSGSRMSKIFFGFLRFLGFGYIEANGEGSVDFAPAGTDGVWRIIVKIGVRVESTEALAASLIGINEKARSLPPGIVAGLVGLKPTKAVMKNIMIDME